MRLQTRMFLRNRFDLVREDGFFGMSHRVVEMHIVSQISFQVPQERKERGDANSTRDPDLLVAASLVVE